MKAGLILAGLASIAAAQPHRRHQHLHEKRQDVVVDVVTAVVTAAADVVVYVNEAGQPISTSYINGAAQPTAAPIAEAVQVSVAAPAAAPAQTTAAAASPSTPQSSVAAASSPAAPSSSSSSGSSSSSNSGYGITYSPYNADGTCKTSAQVNTDFEQINGYDMIRLYGVDCNQLNTVGSAAIAKGMKLFAGVFDITQVASEVAEIIAFAGGNWDNFHTINIGNELINSGGASVSEVVAALGLARGLLSAAGYTGKLVTVDTWDAILANPALCQASDYAAANAHAFFDADITAANAGAYVLSCAQAVSSACGGMDTMITESGWPSQGNANGQAVPSEANQQTAISSLKSTFSNNLILFNAYNDLWKTNNAYTFDAEQYWGILGTSST